ncbi:alpha-L-fucosidase [Leyella stercorea]|uniref:alpha-L-fucosidase n=1 Tax=Leyella stercorea TaxID=363265 RepID=UPI00242BBF2A|nr:alpha-L-fucosidase [Leyella stercorea]
MKMKRILCSLLCAAAVSGAVAQNTAVQETKEQKDKRMEWFDHAKLGIFIHYGIYAVNGVSESWSFHNKYLPYEQYMAQCDGFTAKNYDPKAWLDLIKESGARYTVLTTKHHDGVALWDTKYSDLNTVKATAAKRDLVTPFVKEVRKHGLKLGLYYSLIDWSHPDYPNFTRTESRYNVTEDPERWQKFLKFDFDQLDELNKYKPDLYWFDGDWEQSAETWNAKGMSEFLRKANKNVIINSRIQGYGDYATPEQGVPVVRPEEKHWELCMTMNDSWGYQHADTNYKSPYILLRTFVDCLSMGGNMLLDIGPKEDGTIPEEQVAVLKEFGRWTKKHKEAIYDTRAGIPCEHFQGYTTLNKAGDVLYLYLPYKPNGPIEVKGLMNKVNRVWVVGDGEIIQSKVYNKNYWSEVPGNLYIDVPEHALDPMITVVAVLLDGPIKLYRGAGKVIESN